MTGCLYCIDNDIIRKLASFELFDETIALFGASYADVAILTTAQYQFQAELRRKQRANALRPKEPPIDYEKAIHLAKTLPKVNETLLDFDLLEQLMSFGDVDRGEAVLTTYVAQLLKRDNTQKAFVFTGDKRYLRALAKVELAGIQNAFHNRVWCLEQLVLRNLNEYGFDFVRAQVVPKSDCDKACRAIFGSGMQSVEENVVIAAKGYIESLRKETGNLLHPYPG